MAAHMSKEEYLKRYLSSDAPSSGQIKKRRKKKKPVNEKIVPRSRIVDDDVDFNSLLPENLSNTLDDDIGDNDPTVAEVIDERPEHIKRIENYRKDDRWKVLGQSDDEDEYGIVKDGNHSDASPPRRRQRYDSDSDPSPPRNARMCSDSDQSPPRRKKHNSDSDQSPPRKKRNDSDSDQSPPRKKRNQSDSDQSASRRKPCDSDSDQSPPRRKRNDSDSDQSPVRRKKDSKVKSRTRDMESVNRKPSKKHSRNLDSSRKHDSDEEIPRKKMKTDAKPTQTLGGAKAGLSSAKEMRQEAEKMKKKEEESFKKIGDDRLGRNAETVFRDKSGKRRNLKEEQAKQSEEDIKKAEEMEKYKKWSQGLKQREDQQKSLSQALHEASKPLARYKDDNDLDKHLRDMERAEDPMLAFIKKKKAKHNTKPEKPRYKGPMPPPNRFSIMPGYRWDGVNRSNGFEAQIFAKASEQKATKSMAYKWSVEEM